MVHVSEHRLEKRAADQPRFPAGGIETLLDNPSRINLPRLIRVPGCVFVTALRKFAPVAAMLCLSTQAYAAAGWTSSLTIQSFIPTDNGLKLIVSGNDNPMGCSSPTWLNLHLTDPNFDLISSTLLTAYAQGKTVKVWEGGCETDGMGHFWAVWVGS